jgi:formylglycine-generating enzyme required for sulfatase activity
LALAAAFIVGLLLVAGGGFAVYRLMSPSVVPQKQQKSQDPPSLPNQNSTDNPQKSDLLKIEMVSIPGGTFMMGVDKGQPQAQPAHKITVPSFQMSKYEITNEQYEQFVKETGHRAPGNWLNGRYLPEEAKLPVVAVSFEDATAYAKWLSEREKVEYALPTEEQWEFAARNGESGNLYPWGNNWEDGRAVMESFAPKPVGSTKGGANNWGVEDLIGNVWEWTQTRFEPYPGTVKLDNLKPGNVIRGGGFSDKTNRKPDPINSVFRNNYDPALRFNQIGFRLVIN